MITAASGRWRTAGAPSTEGFRAGPAPDSALHSGGHPRARTYRSAIEIELTHTRSGLSPAALDAAIGLLDAGKEDLGAAVARQPKP